MNKVEIRGCNSRMSIENMPEGCLFYDNQKDVCMKVHCPGKNDSDFCYYVNLRTSFFCETPRDSIFNIINSEVKIRTIW